MTPVLFLDIDGVLNSQAYFDRGAVPGHSWASGIERERVTLINRIVEATGAPVVICSDWRHLLTLSTLRKLFRRQGFVGRILGTTNALRNADRGLECAAWLASTRRPIDAFAAIDDRWDFFDIRSRHVRPNPLRGISDKDADRAIRILRRSAKTAIARFRTLANDLRADTVVVRTRVDVRPQRAGRVLEEVYARIYPKLVTVPC